MKDRIKEKLRWDKPGRKYIGIQGKKRRSQEASKDLGGNLSEEMQDIIDEIKDENVTKEDKEWIKSILENNDDEIRFHYDLDKDEEIREKILSINRNVRKATDSVSESVNNTIKKIKGKNGKKLRFSREKFPEMFKFSLGLSRINPKNIWEELKKIIKPKKEEIIVADEAVQETPEIQEEAKPEIPGVEEFTTDKGQIYVTEKGEVLFSPPTEKDLAADSSKDESEAEPKGTVSKEDIKREKRRQKKEEKAEKKAAKKERRKEKRDGKKAIRREKNAIRRERLKASWKAKSKSTKICIILITLILIICIGLAGYMLIPPFLQSIPQRIEDLKNRPDTKDEAILEAVEGTVEQINVRRELFQNYAIAGASGIATEKIKYVSSTAAPNGNGSENAPFDSIQKGIESLTTGEVLYIKGGTYKENININKQGSSGAYITITSQPGEKVVLEGADKNGSTPIITFQNSKYITLSNIEICEGSQAVKINNSRNIIIAGNVIHDIKNKNGLTTAISISNQGPEPIRAVYLYYNKIYNCGVTEGSAVFVEGNAEYVNLMGNIIENVKGDGIKFVAMDGVKTDGSRAYPRNCSISGNTVKLCRASASGVGMSFDGARDISVEDNVIFRCDKGLEVINTKNAEDFTANILIKNNLLTCNYSGAIFIGTGNGNTVSNVGIQNITTVNSYNSANQGDILIEKAKGIKISDSILYNEKQTGYPIAIKYSKEQSSNIMVNSNMYMTLGTENTVPFMYYGDEVEGLEKWNELSGDSSIYYYGALEGICQRSSLGDYSYMLEEHLIGCRILQAAE